MFGLDTLLLAAKSINAAADGIHMAELSKAAYLRLAPALTAAHKSETSA